MLLFKKILPLAALGLVAVGTFKVIETLLDDNSENYEEPTKEPTQEQVQAKMKKLNDELARLIDIKMLNDRRESTNQVESVELMINGVEVNELIHIIEEELNRLVKVNAGFKQTDSSKKRTRKS